MRPCEQSTRQDEQDSSLPWTALSRYAARYAARLGYAGLWNYKLASKARRESNDKRSVRTSRPWRPRSESCAACRQSRRNDFVRGLLVTRLVTSRTLPRSLLTVLPSPAGTAGGNGATLQCSPGGHRCGCQFSLGSRPLLLHTPTDAASPCCRSRARQPPGVWRSHSDGTPRPDTRPTRCSTLRSGGRACRSGRRIGPTDAVH